MTPKLPSEVTDKKYLRMPEENVVESDDEWDNCGKWIISHPHADLRFVDSSWTKLQKLLADGTLLMLKASTAKMAKEGTTILCFTRPGKQEAKRAVRAIRSVINFFGIMYYKLNKQTSEGIDNRFGDKRVSLYMHTCLGVFYTKKNDNWVQDIEDDAENIMPVAREFLLENYPGELESLSTLEAGCFLNLPENQSCEGNGYSKWFMFCSCEDDGTNLTEVQRVWLVAKRLLEEGVFVGITLRKINDACAEVRFHVTADCDVKSRLAVCDRIFNETFCRTVMYFRDGKNRSPRQNGINSPQYDFEYTSSGELYRVTEYGLEYLFL